MIRLTKISIRKYKCYTDLQSFDIDPNVTILVGMNESGKSALLEAIAKTNYFDNDPDLKFNPTFDYPRKEKKNYDKSGKIDEVVDANYLISDKLMEEILEDVGHNLLKSKEFQIKFKYDNNRTIGGFDINIKDFFENKIKTYTQIKKDLAKKIIEIKKLAELNELIRIETEKDESVKQILMDLSKDLSKYFQNPLNWENPIREYVWRVWLNPRIPKYLYYNEFYSLPSRIKILDLQAGKLEEESLKTSKALFELADIDVNKITNSTNFESFIAELEATSNLITDQMFTYWSANKNLRIKFEIDKKTEGQNIVPYLEIRVENLLHRMTLPLKNRSKGFNWFFSFIVWFSKIQENKSTDYIILLDEPGLNLHASAQEDLLKFIEKLSESYQIIYTTHSPFMVDSDHLERVRTIVETETGTHISDTIKEKDSNTIFPLQAALGYNLAQNLFISKKNLLVEGPTDLLYLTILSNILQQEKREGLNEKITIVPVGGLDKVSTFISLLRGNKLDLVCILDSFIDPKSKEKVDDLIKQKIIKDKNIRFYDEFVNLKNKKANVEDLFEVEEYLKIFNSAFPEKPAIKTSDLDSNLGSIVNQINHKLKIDRFNHYRPANQLAKMAVNADFFSQDTLNRFEHLFKEINKLF
jgi:predicted ATP-dependent endonuclease of OLD family